MEITYGIGLALLEMTFIFVGLLILHGLKKVIGLAGFHMALGLLFVFTQIVGAAELKVVTGITGLDFYLSSSILLLPSLAALMVVYITDGTLEAQRLIIGMMAALGLYTYLASLTASQSSWGGYVVSQSSSADMLSILMTESIKKMAATVLAFTLDLFLIPIFFQRLRNLRCNLLVCVTGSLLLVQVLDSVLYSTVCFWGTEQWWEQITLSYLSRGFFIFWLSLIASFYLSRIEYETPGESRRTLDILIAFFGTYGKARKLEQTLKESEERYRILVQKASDMIIIMNTDGIIVEANYSARRLCGIRRGNMAGRDFCVLTGVDRKKWEKLLELDPASSGTLDESHYINCSSRIPATGLLIEFTIGLVTMAGDLMLIVFGRDVTEKRRLEQEREEWQMQLAHKQRLESIGQLAGGIAHDFNNYLHAIQGHLDIVQYMCDVTDESVKRHLDKIDMITGQASTLTSQLLGFARKGKYNESVFHLLELVKSSAALFMPNAINTGIGVKIVNEEAGKIRVKGDLVQLQQALLNMMFNARDAMEKVPLKKRQIIILAGTAERLGIHLDPPAELKSLPPAQYCAIRIEDNGTGIPKEVKHRLFEPFFTTKPVGQGTGMGLSMAYGTAMGHNGWIQCENLPGGTGAAFTLILPIEKKDSP